MSLHKKTGISQWCRSNDFIESVGNLHLTHFRFSAYSILCCNQLVFFPVDAISVPDPMGNYDAMSAVIIARCECWRPALPGAPQTVLGVW